MKFPNGNKNHKCNICDYDTAKIYRNSSNNSWAFHNNFSQGNYTPICILTRK